METNTFFELQRARIANADGSTLDQEVRRHRFKHAEADNQQAVPESVVPAVRSHYDPVKAGYQKLRMLYS